VRHEPTLAWATGSVRDAYRSDALLWLGSDHRRIGGWAGSGSFRCGRQSAEGTGSARSPIQPRVRCRCSLRAAGRQRCGMAALVRLNRVVRAAPLGRPLLAERFGSFGLQSMCLKSSARRTTGVRYVAAGEDRLGARLWPTARGQVRAFKLPEDDTGNDRSQSTADAAQCCAWRRNLEGRLPRIPAISRHEKLVERQLVKVSKCHS